MVSTLSRPLKDWEGLRLPVEDADGSSSLPVCAEAKGLLEDSGISTTSWVCMELTRSYSRNGKYPWAPGVGVDIFLFPWAFIRGVRLTWDIVIACISLWTEIDDVSTFLIGRGLWEPSWFYGEWLKFPWSQNNFSRNRLHRTLWGERETSLDVFLRRLCSLPCFGSWQTFSTLLGKGCGTWYFWDKSLTLPLGEKGLEPPFCDLHSCCRSSWPEGSSPKCFGRELERRESCSVMDNLLESLLEEQALWFYCQHKWVVFEMPMQMFNVP